MRLYSQRAAAWTNHALGYGPRHTSLGVAGCLVTDFAMILNDSGFPVTPASLDEQLSRAKLYLPEGGGLFDLCTDNMLDRLHPGRYRTTVLAGFNAAAIKAAVPSKDTYVVLWVSTAKVPTHFVMAYSADGSLIADPWTGAVGRLSGYGGPGSVHKTILVRALPPPAPVAAKPPVVVQLPVNPPITTTLPAPPPVAPAPPPATPALPKPAPPEAADFPGVLQAVLILLLRALFRSLGQAQP